MCTYVHTRSATILVNFPSCLGILVYPWVLCTYHLSCIYIYYTIGIEYLERLIELDAADNCIAEHKRLTVLASLHHLTTVMLCVYKLYNVLLCYINRPTVVSEW